MDTQLVNLQSEDNDKKPFSSFTFRTYDERDNKYYKEEGFNNYIWWDIEYYKDKIFARSFCISQSEFYWGVDSGAPSFKAIRTNTKTSEKKTFLRIESPEYLKNGVTHFELTLHDDYAEFYNSYTNKTIKLEYLNEMSDRNTYKW